MSCNKMINLNFVERTSMNIMILVIAALLGKAAYSKESNLSYDVEMSFLYSDWLMPATFTGRDKLLPGSLNAISQPKTLGLERAVFRMHWLTPGDSRLNVTLRPDAAIVRDEDGAEQNSQVDTRSGDSYRPLPKIYLLDLYSMEFQMESQFSLEVGVIQGVLGRRNAEETLEFGLKVMLPEKFFGVVLNNHFFLDTNQPNIKMHELLLLRVFVFQGRDDRGERVKINDRSFDEISVASDPMMAGALSLDYVDSDLLYVSSLLGYGDQKLEVGYLNEVFGRLMIGGALNPWSQVLEVYLDTRYSQEIWKKTEQPRKSLDQLSSSLNLNYAIKQSTELLFSYSWGSSQRHDGGFSRVAKHTGYEVEGGFRYLWSNDLSAGCSLSGERRDVKSPDGNVRAGFINDQRKRREISRVGCKLTYQAKSY